ncbi:CheR family methyltransferase [Bacteroidota bacterium]
MEIESQDIQEFVNTVKSLSDYDFTDYSDKSLQRRLSKILLDHHMTPDLLLERIKKDQAFLEKIVKDITVNTTELFRDPVIWHSLRYDILPRFQNLPQINIWHPGCSTGQEVFSMMILLNEMGLLQKSRIYATDINQDVLDVARVGVYKYRFNEGYLSNFDAVIKENPRDSNTYFDVPYSKYFHIDKTRDNIRMNKLLLGKPLFKKQDLVRDPNPFMQVYDLIVCRNVIIYFNYELQNKVFKLFLDNMNQGSCLVLGVHETILGPFASRFNKKSQAYFKK